MRSIFLTAVLAAFACSTLFAQEPMNTVLSGKITDFQPAAGDDFIDLNFLTVFGKSGPTSYKKRLSPEGEFRFELYLPDAQDVELNYADRPLTLLLASGEPAYVEFSAARLAKGEPAVEVMQGRYGEENFVLNRHRALLEELASSEFNPFATKGLPEMEFRAGRLADLDSARIASERIFRENAGFSPALRDWWMQYLEYSAGKDLLLYPFMARINREISARSEYFNFAEVIKSSPDAEVVNGKKFDFIDVYRADLGIICLLNPVFKEEISRRGPCATYLSLLTPGFQGKDKAAALSNLFYAQFLSAKEDALLSVDSLYKYVHDPYILRKITGASRIAQASFTRLLADFDAPEQLRQDIAHIVGAGPGKTIYIDVWSTWCGPCMREMPHYKTAAEKFSEVDFLFLCAKAEPADWENVRVKYDLPGRHYLLTENQLAFFEDKLGVRGYPSHLMIRDGQVLFGNSPETASTWELLDAILREIHP